MVREIRPVVVPGEPEDPHALAPRAPGHRPEAARLAPVSRRGYAPVLVLFVAGVLAVAGLGIGGRVLDGSRRASPAPTRVALVSPAPAATSAPAPTPAPASTRVPASTPRPGATATAPPAATGWSLPVPVVSSPNLVRLSRPARHRPEPGDGLLEITGRSRSEGIRDVFAALTVAGRVVGRGEVAVEPGGRVVGWIRYEPPAAAQVGVLVLQDLRSGRVLARSAVPLEAAQPIVITAPAAPHQVFSGSSTSVAGRLDANYGDVSVRLEDAVGRTLSELRVRPTPPQSRIVGASRVFSVTLPLPAEVPPGPLWIAVSTLHWVPSPPTARVPVVVVAPSTAVAVAGGGVGRVGRDPATGGAASPPRFRLSVPSSGRPEPGDGVLEIRSVDRLPPGTEVFATLSLGARSIGRGELPVSEDGTVHGWLRYATSPKPRVGVLTVGDIRSGRVFARTRVDLLPAEPIVVHSPAIPYQILGGAVVEVTGRSEYGGLVARLEDADGRVLVEAKAPLVTEGEAAQPPRGFVARLPLPPTMPSGPLWITVASEYPSVRYVRARIPVFVAKVPSAASPAPSPSAP